jgi:uncharacterized membrane protein SpoIIM required for sporulation
MSQASFVDKNEPTWREFEELVHELEQDYPSVPADHFPRMYRTLCQHLSIARHRGYSAAVVGRLNPLVERGHALLYGSRTGRWQPLLDYIRGGFARDVRRDWPLLTLATLLFAGPFLGMMAWLSVEPDWAYHVLGDQMVTQMESMYSSSDAIESQRQADSNFMMFGFYIYNNVGIALRTFGSGAVAGLGALVALFYNGVVLGAVAGHLNNAGMGQNFWPFVIGHGSFELTAIVLAGMAGLKLGFAPIWPGRKSRLQALKDTARQSLGLVTGFFVMLVIAAFIEGFWSAAAVEDSVKYTVGAGLWAVVLLYFAFAGRR